jgi:hypothetical protein
MNCALNGAPLQRGGSGELMANNPLMLIKLDTDTIARLSLVIGIIALILSLVNTIVAAFADLRPKRVTTKDKEAPVEKKPRRHEEVSNTISSIDTRTPQQEEREALQAQGQRVSISVEGEAVGDVALELLITLQDSSVRISRVESRTEAGRALGSSPCRSTNNVLVFKSIVTQEKMRQWWDAGELTDDIGTRGVLRVYVLLDASGKEVYRDVPVTIVESLRNVGIATLVVWTVKGSV